jgi:hypothetical protein
LSQAARDKAKAAGMRIIFLRDPKDRLSVLDAGKIIGCSTSTYSRRVRRDPARVSVSALFDGDLVAVFDGSDSPFPFTPSPRSLPLPLKICC